jgi:hypothetical protein
VIERGDDSKERRGNAPRWPAVREMLKTSQQGLAEALQDLEATRMIPDNDPAISKLNNFSYLDSSVVESISKTIFLMS